MKRSWEGHRPEQPMLLRPRPHPRLAASLGLQPSEPPDTHPNMALETDPPHGKQLLQPLKRQQDLGKESDGNHTPLPLPAVQTSPGLKRDWTGEEGQAWDRGPSTPSRHGETGPTLVTSPFTLGPSALGPEPPSAPRSPATPADSLSANRKNRGRGQGVAGAGAGEGRHRDCGLGGSGCSAPSMR